MILGSVSNEGVPVISIKVGQKDFQATIDTGFNGDLELPESFRSQLNARFVCRDVSFLAAGQMIEEDLYLVEFPFDGRIMIAQATFVSGVEILIGTHLLRRHRLEIDFAEQTVRLEQKT